MPTKCGCFIRKDTPEIRKRLEEMGYAFEKCYGKGCICTQIYFKYYTIISEDMFDDPDPRTSWKADRIDCGTDEEKFFSYC